MTRTLQSYVHDAWWTPADDASGTEVRDASTGEVVARVSSEGLDLAGAMDLARNTGQTRPRAPTSPPPPVKTGRASRQGRV